jgi:hypothetical protein
MSHICGDYIRRVLDWQLDLLDCSCSYTLQLTTIHYNTCWVFTLYLHWLPVIQYRRIRSPATLQPFSEDCCSARILTRNCLNSELYYSSQSHFMTDDQSVSASWFRALSGAHDQMLITVWLESKSRSHYDRRPVGHWVLVSSPVWGSWPDVNYCLTVTVLSISGAPSDERLGLSFVDWQPAFLI